jgi:uncharacterized protein YecE (DUF72 family)
VEFRDPSWYVDEVFAALEEHGVALCLHDRLGAVTPMRVIGPFVYVRFHGPTGAYAGGYSAAALDRWAEWLAPHAAAGRDVFAYFNNDPDAQAPRDAVALRDRLARILPPPDNQARHVARTRSGRGARGTPPTRAGSAGRQHHLQR